METRKYPVADIEKSRAIFFEIGLILSLMIIFATFEWRSTPKYTPVDFDYQAEKITEEIVPITEQKAPPPKVKIPNTAITIKVVENDAETEDIDINVEADESTEVQEYVPEVNYQMEEEEEPVSEEIFVIVESMPEYPGGINALYQYISDQIHYPVMAKELGIQGKVFVTFVIETDGSVSGVEVLRGIGGGCDEEAIRVVNSLPKWKPGKQRGVPVRVRYNLPVKFTLL
ncbi:MAG: energy transducer TonB [Marinilabiliales bacterium]|nr:MAG: energy transducer TonB [Marinilabiliales bacterium]